MFRKNFFNQKNNQSIPYQHLVSIQLSWKNYFLRKGNQGMVALGLAFILMIIMITVVITIGTIVFQRIGIAGEIQNRHIAFHLAETGIEAARNKQPDCDSISPQKIAEGKYFWTRADPNDGICTVESFGNFRGTVRLLTIQF